MFARPASAACRVMAVLLLAACGSSSTDGGATPPVGGRAAVTGGAMGNGAGRAGTNAVPTDGGTASAGVSAAGGVMHGGVMQGGFGAMPTRGGTGGAAGEPAQGGTIPSSGAGAAPVGGSAGGATTAGGAAGVTLGGAVQGPQFPFFLGADISSVPEASTTYRDTDGQAKSVLALLKNHGFNYIRLKTFVDPTAPFGYASRENGCTGFPEAFGDRDHVVAYGREVKAAGMGFLLDFHYSDVWADPGNQIIPAPWRAATSVTELAALLKAYTKDVLRVAVAAGARPDMVQVGNEITPGMLMHVPGPNTDCYGNNPVAAPFGGSTANWNDLATLLKAAIAGVREIDPTIQVVLHVENTHDLTGVKRWIDNARARNVEFDVLGLSCYTAYQGQPSVWQGTFSNLATSYPDLQFIIAEYNPERTQANLIMKNLPSARGLGTFLWEPTRSGEWGAALFTRQGNVFVANADAFAEYDALRPQLGL